MQTDKGKEFVNKQVQAYLKEQAIRHFASESDQKAAMVERFNRTLKGRMWKYFTAQNTHRYLDMLPDLLDAYNHAKHRTIGMAPADVTPAHKSQLWQKMYSNYGVRSLESAHQKLKVVEAVRIIRAKDVFEKDISHIGQRKYSKSKLCIQHMQVHRLDGYINWKTGLVSLYKDSSIPTKYNVLSVVQTKSS